MNSTQTIIEFISPFETDLTLLFLGDEFNASAKKDIKSTIKEVRKITGVKPNNLKYVDIPTSKLFRGAAEPYVDETDCILFFSPQLSKDTINIILQNSDHMDVLDVLLIKKYIIDLQLQKYVFDISTMDDAILVEFIAGLDLNPVDFSYLIQDNMVAIWISYKEILPHEIM